MADPIARAYGGTQPAAAPEAEHWPDPAPPPTELPPVEPFADELLPSAWQPWVADVAARMQCPPEFVVVPALATLGAVVGRQLAIRPKRADDWEVVPNLWACIVARPGLMKSPALEEALRLLLPLEAKAHADNEADQLEYEAQRIVSEAEKKDAAEAVQKAVRSGDDPRDHAQRAVAAGRDANPPARRRYRTSDSTVEKLGELLRDNPRGILVQRDELVGWLRSLERDGREADRAFYLEAWAGTGGFTYDRIGRGTVDIPAACVSLLGTIQPGPLRAYLAGCRDGTAGDDGLLQRFQLAVWPDAAATWQNVDRPPDAAARRRVQDTFNRLDCIDPDTVGAIRPLDGLPHLHFAAAAQDTFDDWRAQLEVRLRDGSLPPALESHLSKFRSLVPSLALLLHLANGDTGPVGPRPILQACGWAEYLESHARRIYSTALSPAAAGAVALAEHIRRGDLADGFRGRDAYRPQWTALADRDTVQQAIEYLVDLDWLRADAIDTGGRPSVVYRINPKTVQEVR